MELTNTLKQIFIETAKTLKGSDRRLFMAKVVKAMGKGGQRQAETESAIHQNIDVVNQSPNAVRV